MEIRIKMDMDGIKKSGGEIEVSDAILSLAITKSKFRLCKKDKYINENTPMGTGTRDRYGRH